MMKKAQTMLPVPSSHLRTDMLLQQGDGYSSITQQLVRGTYSRILWICKHVHGKSVLDIGSSQGAVPILLGREGLNVLGVDIDADAIRNALQQLAKEPDHIRQRVGFLAEQFSLHSFPRVKVDTVIVGETLAHIMQPEILFAKVVKCLRKHGRLIVTVPIGQSVTNDYQRTFYLLEPLRLLAQHFDILEIEILGKWFGIVAVLREAPRDRGAGVTLTSAQLEKLEAALLDTERRFREELLDMRRKMEDANERYRLVSEQASAQQSQMREEEAARRAAEIALGLMQSRTEHSDARLGSERGALQQKAIDLENQLKVAQLNASRIQGKFLQLEAEHAMVRAALKETTQKHRSADEEVARLRKLLSQKEGTTESLGNELSETALQLKQPNEKHQEVVTDDWMVTKAELKEQEDLVKELQDELKRYRKSLASATQMIDSLQEKLRLAEQQSSRLRDTLSFQLGYSLLHGFKSLKNFAALPGTLWGLFREAGRRRREKKEKRPAFRTTPGRSIASPGVSDASSPLPPPRPQLLANAGRLLEELRKLKVACVMDEFTFSSYRDICQLQQLTPQNWQLELNQFQPQLLIVESAWRGKDDLWNRKVGHTGQELRGIVDWCRSARVPAVFWNKEDPVHFSTFLTTARLFDYVFTTDIDCIPAYKKALGHDRVYLLPFACQPAISNPVETSERKDALCFAGAYYLRYPDRTRDLRNLLDGMLPFRTVDIYDRNYGKNDPNYQFPEEYRRHIVGSLPFDQIDKAYKGYRYAINLNSIKQSQSMFARRVYELLACNTIIVSNFSRGLRLMFGDLVLSTDSGSEALKRLQALAADEEHARKLRLAGLRKVMQEHTYSHRLAYIASKISGQAIEVPLPAIAVTAAATTASELDTILESFLRQRYANCSLLLGVPDNLFSDARIEDSRVRLVRMENEGTQEVPALAGQAEFIAAMVAEDYYGPNYLLDIALASRYSTAEAIGKVAHYAFASDAIFLHQPDQAYRPADRLLARRAAIRTRHLAGIHFSDWIASLPGREFHEVAGLAIDEFNYCAGGAISAARQSVGDRVDDLCGLDSGISVNDLLTWAERLSPEAGDTDTAKALSGRELASSFPTLPGSAIALDTAGDFCLVTSSLPDGEHEYIYSSATFRPAELGFSKQMRFFLETSPGLNTQLGTFFLDKEKRRISSAVKPANRNEALEIPRGTEHIRFALRFLGTGNTEIRKLVLGHRQQLPSELLSKCSHLVLTNHYPTYADLYRNGFVHSRVRAYQSHGIKCDVFRLREDQGPSFHEFENIDVVTGSQEVLDRMLSSGRYRNILVHFLNEQMWEVLQHHIERVNVLVWVHGAEVHPWWRRAYNYRTEQDRAEAQKQSQRRLAFWRKLLQPVPRNLKLVFVSRYLAEEVMQDLGFRIPEDYYAIIHNPIDTELFSYHEKAAVQRKKILSIRPYATRQYANDLSTKAIQILASKPWFDDLEFRLIGDGPLFEETLAPLLRYPNVHIERRFLQREEIAALHKEHGVFLCPTRWDSQGVSRDEAMASGLVPVTSAVAAIPEFADSQCAVLAPADDPESIAAGIERLYQSPEQFMSMSRAAAERVRRQRAMADMVNAELSLLK